MSGEPVRLSYVGDQIQLQTCSLYPHRHPMLEAHHLCPESWWNAAHKPVASPLVTLCPNCHYGVHVAIDGLLRKRDTKLLRARWLALARQAFVLAEQNGLQPAPTL